MLLFLEYIIPIMHNQIPNSCINRLVMVSVSWLMAHGGLAGVPGPPWGGGGVGGGEP